MATVNTLSSSSNYKPFVLKRATLPIYGDMPQTRPDSVLSKRSTYLKSIGSWALKQAAQEQGLDIKFGTDAQNWLDKNPQLKNALPEIQARAAELVKAKNAAAANTSSGVDITV